MSDQNTSDERSDSEELDRAEATESAELDADEEASTTLEPDPIDDPDGADALGEEEEVEDRRMSFAARALLVLLLLIGGAAGALWGGPKLVPHLPGWASPLAKYLAPGGEDAKRDVAALSETVDARFAEIEIPGTDEIRAISEEVAGATTTEALDGLSADVSARLEALEVQIGEGVELAGIEARLTTLETQIEGVSAEIQSLTESLQTATLNGTPIAEESQAAITANTALVAGLQAEVEALSARVGGLDQNYTDTSSSVSALDDRMTAFETAAQDQVAAALADAEATAHDNAIRRQVASLAAAVAAGDPFEEELAALAELGVDNVSDTLNAAATGGVHSVDALRDAFQPLAHDAIRSSIRDTANDAGALGRLGAFVQSRVATRSLEPQEGDSTDAILSRIGHALDTGELATISDEAATLPEGARDILAGWLADVEARRAALDAIDALGAQSS